MNKAEFKGFFYGSGVTTVWILVGSVFTSAFMQMWQPLVLGGVLILGAFVIQFIALSVWFQGEQHEPSPTD